MNFARRLSAVPRIWRTVRESGLRAAWTQIRVTVARRLGERRLGLDTEGSIESRALGCDEPQSFGYQPIPHLCLEAALDRIDAGRDDVFLDLGCGKGRALLTAARWPFQRVIGVELSAELSRVAERNLQRLWQFGQPRSSDFEVVHCDATRYQIPADVSVIFFYNPFAGPLMESVLGGIRESLARHPRELTILYALPGMDPDLMQDCSWLHAEPLVFASAAYDWLRFTIYRARPDVVAAEEYA